MTAKQQILNLLNDGVYRNVQNVATILGFPIPATRRNLNQLRNQNEVLSCIERDGGVFLTSYYRVVVQ